MATVEEDVPAALVGACNEEDRTWAGRTTNMEGANDSTRQDKAPHEQDKKDKALPVRTTGATETTTHLPTPLPSPRPVAADAGALLEPDGREPLDPNSAFSSGQQIRGFPKLAFIDTSIDGMGLDLANSLSSCAVSEAEADGSNSAMASSADAMSPDPNTQHETPKPKPSRRSSRSGRTRIRSGTKSNDHSGVRRLSASKIQQLAASPDSLPVGTIPAKARSAGAVDTAIRPSMAAQISASLLPRAVDKLENRSDVFTSSSSSWTSHSDRPDTPSRATMTSAYQRKSNGQPGARPPTSRRNSYQPSSRPMPVNMEGASSCGPADQPKLQMPEARPRHEDSREPRDNRVSRDASPIPPRFPIPPMSVPTFLQLELAAQQPSPLYIRQSYSNGIPYESSAVKFERLKNFLWVWPLLERTLVFGALACLDAWLWTLTILPLRFLLAGKVLVGWWGYVFTKEVRWLIGFVWEGLGRMWRRARFGQDSSKSHSRRSSEAATSRSPSRGREPGKELNANGTATGLKVSSGDALKRTESSRAKLNGIGLTLPGLSTSRPPRGTYHHKASKSMPSNLSSFHKADLLQYSVIIMSSVILTQLDASRMYHFVRAQSAVKLYVIYNLIEVGDRLLSALGQDIFECLFSSETLSRNDLGRSKVLLPFGMFCLALVYNCAHAVTLFYQVITLNVAINSYSNALLTLLMSNQFVEIKGSVFKKFEKENLFQLTCADIVERFQIWIVLFIIGLRNLVEVGGLSAPGTSVDLGDDGASAPMRNASVLPSSFGILPSWLWSAEMLSPFFVVIVSEIIVDLVKHAYINKFNNIKPNFYSRVLDILCKDYYTNAFVNPSLTRRLGLPLLPLSTLFIRSSFQTYRMFLAIHMPAPLPSSTQTSLSVEPSTPTSPTMTAAVERLHHIIRHALGRSVYGLDAAAAAAAAAAGPAVTASTPAAPAPATWPLAWAAAWTADDAIALATLALVVAVVWLALLALKLVLGMALLRYSRDRYARMRTAAAERAAGGWAFDARGARRVGGLGAVELGEARRAWVYADDPEGLKRARERERKMEEKREKGGDGERELSGVTRYEMVAKRIW